MLSSVWKKISLWPSVIAKKQKIMNFQATGYVFYVYTGMWTIIKTISDCEQFRLKVNFFFVKYILLCFQQDFNFQKHVHFVQSDKYE
ncbi:hypothetical protein T07_13072 [Trichinella nelsoni]|uniref:Uncharacterized protein n=1 Tax=Trichinella nelsoni TaxID=6336 RepID=A0A0V0SLA0_9BILA|nr:hypothetical protein T07_13072 [Trichinella nelsoni]